jgi:hypothetical protein
LILGFIGLKDRVKKGISKCAILTHGIMNLGSLGRELRTKKLSPENETPLETKAKTQ